MHMCLHDRRFSEFVIKALSIHGSKDEINPLRFPSFHLIIRTISINLLAMYSIIYRKRKKGRRGKNFSRSYLQFARDCAIKRKALLSLSLPVRVKDIPRDNRKPPPNRSTSAHRAARSEPSQAASAVVIRIYPRPAYRAEFI